MKNLNISIMLLVFISSCSTDSVIEDNDNSEMANDDSTEVANDESTETTDNDSSEESNNEISDLSLSSYELTYYPSENQTIFEFEDGKAIKHTRNDILTGAYEYDAQDRMTKYTTYYQGSGNLETTYTFNYDDDDKITSIDFYDDSPVFVDMNNFTQDLSYEGNSILTNLPYMQDYDFTATFEMNDEGKLVEFEQLKFDGELEVRAIFEYNDEKNCSKVSVTSLDFNGNEFTAEYQYSYDGKANPLFEFHSKYYLNIILMNGKSSGFGFPLATAYARTLGPNNIMNTVYPNSVPEAAQYFFEYDYNDSGYPNQGRTKNVMTQANSVVTNFFYN